MAADLIPLAPSLSRQEKHKQQDQINLKLISNCRLKLELVDDFGDGVGHQQDHSVSQSAKLHPLIPFSPS